jgi:hypothetical protein
MYVVLKTYLLEKRIVMFDELGKRIKQVIPSKRWKLKQVLSSNSLENT